MILHAVLLPAPSALPRALGALGQRTERRRWSLTIALSRACSSATVPVKPTENPKK